MAQKERIIFQASIFRGELAVSFRKCNVSHQKGTFESRIWPTFQFGGIRFFSFPGSENISEFTSPYKGDPRGPTTNFQQKWISKWIISPLDGCQPKNRGFENPPKSSICSFGFGFPLFSPSILGGKHPYFFKHPYK